MVGLAHLHVSPTIEHERPAAKIGALVVAESHRGEASAGCLSKRSRRKRGAGLRLLFVTTAERREDAHAFYDSLGLEQTGERSRLLD